MSQILQAQTGQVAPKQTYTASRQSRYSTNTDGPRCGGMAKLHGGDGTSEASEADVIVL
jgi:hypothetical protein